MNPTQNTAGKVYLKGITSPIAPESEFSLGVYTETKDAVNAFDLEIYYPKDKLQFLGFDNTSSIVNIWQPQPLELPNGNFGLSGGIIKAFSGENGLLVKIYFRALTVGESKISFVKNNLYMADGKGTLTEASAPDFFLSVKENAKVVSSPSIPFKATPENIIIAKELDKFESSMFFKKIFPPSLFLILTFIVLVICVIGVYNKHKRKL